MAGSRSSEKLILLVLMAAVGTFFLGRVLLQRAQGSEPGTVHAEPKSKAESLPAAPSGERSEKPDVETAPSEISISETPAAPEPPPTPAIVETSPWTGPVRVRGQVLSRAGATPARLVWRPVAARAEEELRAVETDAGGEFAVTLTRAGRHLVEIRPTGFFEGVSTSGIELLVDVPSQAVARIPLGLPSGRLEGTLTDANGQAVEDAFLELTSANASFGCTESTAARRTLSDERGRFRFDFLEPGDYIVSTLFSPGSGSVVPEEADPNPRVLATSPIFTVAPPRLTSIGLRLPPLPAAASSPSESASGGVRVLSHGQPAFGATVWLRRLDRPALGGTPIGTTGRDGLVTLPVLDSALNYAVFARASDSASRAVPLANNAFPLDLILEPAHWIAITTRDEEGRTVSATVEVSARQGLAPGGRGLVWARRDPLAQAHWEASATQGNGLGGLLGPLLPGSYRIGAKTQDGRVAHRTIELDRDAGTRDAPARFQLILPR